MHATKSTLYLHASRPQFKILLWLSVLSVIICLWLSYQLAIGKPYWQGFLTILVLTIFTTTLTIKQKTESLIFEDGHLTLTSFFVRQRVYLPALVHAERHVTAGKYPSLQLALEDNKGGRLILDPSDFTMKDLEVLVDLISPYIFITRVEKNFMDLQFYLEQGLDIPKSSVWHIARGTFLFVLLPCIILTVLLIFLAVITNRQTTFR